MQRQTTELSSVVWNVYPELLRLLDLKCVTLERIWTEFDRQLLTQAWNSIHLWNEKGPTSFWSHPQPLFLNLIPPRGPRTSHAGDRWCIENVYGVSWLGSMCLSSVAGSLLFHSRWTRKQCVMRNVYGAGRNRKWIHTRIKLFGSISYFEMCCTPRRLGHFIVDFFASINVLFSTLTYSSFIDRRGYLLGKSSNSSNIFWLLV